MGWGKEVSIRMGPNSLSPLVRLKYIYFGNFRFWIQQYFNMRSNKPTLPLKWHGGKSYLADWIIDHMPRHLSIFRVDTSVSMGSSKRLCMEKSTSPLESPHGQFTICLGEYYPAISSDFGCEKELTWVPDGISTRRTRLRGVGR